MTVIPDATEFPTYDAAIVFCGGLVVENGEHRPSGYFRPGHRYGISGTWLRYIAAAELVAAGLTNTVIFSGGGKYKPASAAEVHAQAFHDYLSQKGHGLNPEVLLETESDYSEYNIKYSLPLLRPEWTHVAGISSYYHCPRLLIMWQQLAPEWAAKLSFPSAENVVRTLAPGKFDAEIDNMLASPQARHREKMEAQGLADWQAGRYESGRHSKSVATDH